MKVSDIVIPVDYGREEDPKHVAVLADLIRDHGLIQPLIVKASNRELISGFYRLAACKAIGMETVAVWLVTNDVEANEYIAERKAQFAYDKLNLPSTCRKPI